MAVLRIECTTSIRAPILFVLDGKRCRNIRHHQSGVCCHIENLEPGPHTLIITKKTLYDYWLSLLQMVNPVFMFYKFRYGRAAMGYDAQFATVTICFHSYSLPEEASFIHIYLMQRHYEGYMVSGDYVRFEDVQYEGIKPSSYTRNPMPSLSVWWWRLAHGCAPIGFMGLVGWALLRDLLQGDSVNIGTVILWLVLVAWSIYCLSSALKQKSVKENIAFSKKMQRFAEFPFKKHRNNKRH